MSMRTLSPSLIKAIGPPSTASGATCPTHRPVEPPENRPSVNSNVDLPRPEEKLVVEGVPYSYAFAAQNIVQDI